MDIADGNQANKMIPNNKQQNKFLKSWIQNYSKIKYINIINLIAHVYRIRMYLNNNASYDTMQNTVIILLEP